MKAPLAFLLAALGLQAPLAASSENFTNFVRQYQQGSGVYWDMQNVAASGTSASLHALEVGGALFQLWTVEKSTAKDYLLDQKTVGAYLPKAGIEVITRDPYEKVPRTRVDQPFTVRINVSDLLTGTNGLPLAASSVFAEHHLAPYPKGVSGITVVAATSGKPVASGYLTQNGVTTFEFEGSTLKATLPNQAVGEEHFVVHALSDGTISQTQIAAGYVQVWPKATGSISGVKDGERISLHTPPLTLSAQDLYPGSYTYLRAKSLDSDYETVFSPFSFLCFEDKPNDLSFTEPVLDYGEIFPKDGDYRLELVTKTPFGVEVLSSVGVTVDRTLQVRTMQAQIDP